MFALTVTAAALPRLRVAALSHHNGAPSTWNASCAGADVWQCNLQLYESAAAQAVAAGADLLLYPEAYGLDPALTAAPRGVTHGSNEAAAKILSGSRPYASGYKSRSVPAATACAAALS